MVGIVPEATPPFEIAAGIVIGIEKETSFDPAGGTTHWGISQRWHPEIDVSKLTETEARKIYYDEYWCKNRCGYLPWCYALPLFDGGINQGVKIAAMALQRALRVKDDGIVGPRTIYAAKQYQGMPEYVARFMAERALDYVADENGFQTNGLGWMKRLFLIDREIWR